MESKKETLKSIELAVEKLIIGYNELKEQNRLLLEENTELKEQKTEDAEVESEMERLLAKVKSCGVAESRIGKDETS